MVKKIINLLLISAIGMPVLGQGKLIPQTLPNPENEPKNVFPIPSERQMKWQETEFYAFFHYGMNTFTGKEWGLGDENEKIFAPSSLPDCRQWVQTAKAAGMKGGIAVVKHHDGFCLWPTSTTEHNVTRSAGVGPQVNVPKAFAQASEAEGMKYGFYISPWDRNSAYYGRPEYVKNVFLRQATELAQYGADQFEMWFDGANGGDGYYGGERGTRTIDREIYYDMKNLSDSIHKLQPNCVMWGMGGEARWIGNEAGWAQITNWSTVAAPGDEGAAENGQFWAPGEADTKATSAGWFWHSGETAKSPATLFKMYLETVGRNATFILNFPPDQSGRLPQATVNAAVGLGKLIKERLTNDLTKTATITASEERRAGIAKNYVATNMTDGDKNTYWATDDTYGQPTITIRWNSFVQAHYVMLQEYIRKGQRIRKFKIETSVDGVNFTERAADQCTTVGYKRIVPLNGSTNDYGQGFPIRAIRITILDSKACPLIHTLSVF